MFEWLKKIISSSQMDVSIRPIFEDNSIRIGIFKNGEEVNENDLSDKEISYLEEKYVKPKLSLKDYEPEIHPRDSLEEYFNGSLSIEEVLSALKDWEVCPESHPLLEEWYQNGSPEINIEREELPWEVGFDEYSLLFEKAKSIERKDPEKALTIYLDILERFQPNGALYYERPIEILVAQCKYDIALSVLKLGLERQVELGLYEDIILERKRIFKAVLGVLEHSIEVIQTSLYDIIGFTPNKIRVVLVSMEKCGFIKREKFKNTYKLFLKEDYNGCKE